MNFAKPPVFSDSLTNVFSSASDLTPALGATSASLLNPLSLSAWQTSSGASAIAFIDANVSDYQALMAGIAPGTEVHLLDSSQDAVTQITNTLLGRRNISSLHIVSHGENGGLDFGSSALNLTDLSQYAAQLKTWSKALTNDADILLYGCNVAEGEVGQAFVKIISQLTEADVAASNNLTGRNGDWNLEVTTGKIESSLVFDSNVTSAYAYNLDNILGETFIGNDVTNPSWIFNQTGTRPFLTARSTSAPSAGGIPGGGSDAVGSGALRLTSAAGSQASFVIYNRPINASSGFSITFGIHAYGGSGADGISFFLIDGTASPTTAGSVGGSLGYSSNGSTPGLVGGYLGIGFDEFGNFSNPVYGAGGPGATPDSIAVHGSQANSYKYLAGTGTLTPGIDDPSVSATRSTSQRAVQIDLTSAGLLSVKIDLNNDNDFLDANEAPTALQNYDVVASNGALPSTFKFGFSASTGGSTNIHEITGLDVSTFNNTPYVPLVNFTTSTASVSEGAASLNLTAQLDVAASTNVVVPITLSGTAVNGTDYTVSNGSITILAGQLTGSITLNPFDNSVAAPNKTAVVTMGTPTGAQLSPQNNVLTATIVDNEYSLAATGSPTYVENAAPIVIAPTATITGDLTASTINSATVSLGSGFSSAEDRLGIQGQSGTSGTIASTSIAWNYNTTSGVLTFSGTDTADNYQAALRQVAYSDISDTPSTVSRTVAYAINYNGSQQATSGSNPSITVTSVNDAPTIGAPASVTVVEDIATAVTGITFADIDAAAGIVTATFNVAAGTLTAITGSGVTVGGTSSSLTLSGTIANLNAFIAASKLAYQTVLNSNTALTLGVSINDNGNTPGTALTATTNVAINITPVNDAPSLTGNATLGAVTQNTTNPSGSTITSLFGSLFSDVDAGASLRGLAIVGNTANATTQGRWQYSIGGTTWTNIGTVTDGATALALSASTLVRFVPVIGYNGTPPGLTVRALDNTYSGGFSTGTAPALVNTTTPGGTTAISSGTPAALNTSVTPVLPGLVWRNSGNGENAVWALNNFTLQSSYYIPTVTDPAWQIVASQSDFNQDGVADLVWRNSRTGENALWQMSNTGYQTGYFITPITDANWQIVGTADFNRDNSPDLLWRNNKTGLNAIWQMNGFSVQTTSFITPVADINWQIVGTADFTSDGTPDLLWRNNKTGLNAIWQMNGFSVQTTSFITPVADVNWQIVGTGNFNGDATPDIVWRNNKTGLNAIWQMNGMTLQSGYFIDSLVDANWQIAGVADLGGDSTPEILWRNNQASKAMIWQLNGFSYAQTYQLPDEVPDWSVKPFVAASILSAG